MAPPDHYVGIVLVVLLLVFLVIALLFPERF
jgi:K+-transporting ATPase KdpF subunit